ncbi:MAG: DNA replication/repair protein RecF [Pseudomonadota bacterium]|nr:DNA replication/repair protein RecF [Pseudomonadota bacterium]
MALTRLTVQDFRNYASLSLTIDAKLVVLTGGNGVGKTNLIESISLLTPGRGLRRAAFEEITRNGSENGWAVSATVSRDGEETRIGTGLAGEPAGSERARKVRVNGAPASGPDILLDFLRVLWLTPSMDGLFAGPAADRRRFLDRLVLTVDPGHGRRARDFERLLTHRNRLLDDDAAAAWLDAVEAELAERAVAVALARAETVGLLCARILAQAEAAPDFPAGRIGLSGAFDRAVAERRAADAERWYRGVLASGRAADRAAGRTLEGPHRSDLDIVFTEKDMPAARSSTGEQKALLIGLILAHADLVAKVSGITPVLLLDEVAAHLDPARRSALFARLDALGCQTFMTGADPGLFADLPSAAGLYRVADNGVQPLKPGTPA